MKVKANEVTKSHNNIYGLHITTAHTGKMADIFSLSSAVTTNKLCQSRRAVEGSICSHCFAAAQMSYRKGMEQCFIENSKILASGLIPEEQLPDFGGREIVRIESFGDTNNSIQAANYLRIVKANPQTLFAIWTKNPQHYFDAVQAGFEKPDNCNIILSSMYINRPAEVPAKYAGLINKVFTVFDKETSKIVPINCGARSCNTCRRCYRKTPFVEFVNEILK